MSPFSRNNNNNNASTSPVDNSNNMNKPNNLNVRPAQIVPKKSFL